MFWAAARVRPKLAIRGTKGNWPDSSSELSKDSTVRLKAIGTSRRGEIVRRLGAAVPYFYLLRFPLVFSLVLVCFPLVAFKTAASSLLAGIFDLADASPFNNGCKMFLVALLSLMVAWTIMETFWLVLLYAHERFGVSPCTDKRPGKLHALAFSVLASPTLYFAYLETTRAGHISPEPLLTGAAVGILAAFLLLWAINAATPTRMTALSKGPMNRWAVWFVSHPKLSEGYLESENDGHQLRPGHVRAVILLVVSLSIYIAVGYAKELRIGYQPIVPTLAYLLLLLALMCWGLAGMAFFLDRYRIPVFLPLLILFLITSLLPQSDYFYLVSDRQKIDELSPASVMRAGNQSRSSAIVIAASGGGIQASAWTAKVLTGLEIESRRPGQQSEDFGASVRFISAVSGGSVGAMYFVDSYASNGLPPEEGLNRVVQSAEASSLDDIAWGLVYPDLWRTFIPFLGSKYSDRGEALEKALLLRDPEVSGPLSAWKAGVKAGWRPATAFNATDVDTGTRLIFSTSRITPDTLGRWDFSDIYPDEDVSIATAARLSAAFPYVSPAARAILPGPQFHIVDGGYYDNYGISTLIEWLESALNSPTNSIRRVLIVQIRDAPPDTSKKVKKGYGLFYQSFAPISAMLHVRSTGQLSHNEEDVDLLQRAKFPTNVSIESAVFQFPGANPPLSWHLTQTEKSNITDAWNRELSSGDGWKTVRNFLACKPPMRKADVPPCE